MGKAQPAFLYLYATPLGARVCVRLDDGRELVGEPGTFNGRADAHRILLPPGLAVQGAIMSVSAEGMIPFDNRGILDPREPCFKLDDVRLVPVPPPPEPPPPPDPTRDPFAIIQSVYAEGGFDLSTKEGSGLYTEAACTALHDLHSNEWGHIKKEPAQNQFNGHAVDALMLRWPAGATVAGIYDIIWSCESPEAAPAWSFKGEPDPNLWYYPAAAWP